MTLAQQVVKSWEMHTRAGNAGSLTPDFRSLIDMACRTVKGTLRALCFVEYSTYRGIKLHVGHGGGSGPSPNEAVDSVATSKRTPAAMSSAFRMY